MQRRKVLTGRINPYMQQKKRLPIRRNVVSVTKNGLTQLTIIGEKDAEEKDKKKNK